ncbi:MAG TPA: FAD-dependent oxidoreductase [Chloroflexota bacterium]|nr:FAD-dependent oxidoreductase [Chloroflexota bacterium]
MPDARYRLVIVGAGSAGLAAADFAARLGVSVALIERDRVGGDCTWTGCVPSKALLHMADSRADFPSAMAFVQEAIQRVYQTETPEALASRGITVIAGDGRFVDPQTLDVGGRRIRADRVLIATGAQPEIPKIGGLDEVPYLTYESVFELTSLPARLVVLGGGPVGVELAQAFQRLGSQVTLVDRHDRIASVGTRRRARFCTQRSRAMA